MSAVVQLPLATNPSFARLIAGTADQQDALFAAIQGIDGAIGLLKMQKAQLLRAYRAELTRKIAFRRTSPG
jgi:hypothetical protein